MPCLIRWGWTSHLSKQFSDIHTKNPFLHAAAWLLAYSPGYHLLQIFFQLQTSQKDGFGRPGSEDHSCTSQPQCCPSDQWGGPQCSPQGNITILISTTHRKTKTSRLNRLLHLKRWVKSTRPCCRKCAPHFWRQTSTSEWWRSWGRMSRSALTLRRWHRLEGKKNQILTVLDHFWQGLNKRRMIQQAVFRELVALVEPGVCCH